MKEKDFRGIDAGPVSAYWHPSLSSLDWPAVDLRIAERGHLSNNTFGFHQFGLRVVEIGFLQVAKDFRGQGLGERLVRALGALTQKYSFFEIFTSFASQYSLDICGRVFGGERMTFIGPNGNTEARDLQDVSARDSLLDIDISFEEVRRVLVALERREEDLEYRMNGFSARIKLEGLDMSGWGLPVEYCNKGVDLTVFNS